LGGEFHRELRECTRIEELAGSVFNRYRIIEDRGEPRHTPQDTTGEKGLDGLWKRRPLNP
jgi:hypothetical protein